ncbi:MAG TPA: response regulator [Dokdonella sp.]|uniref:response regulator n=1 Tax=Dokdonella sp. TaxID=2291710 RepID=UPI002CE794AF|nr:response regulator [Dokdonella sp.]HUD40935.1 response regulator [Dokdonella sp.]
MTDHPPAFDLLHQRYVDSFARKREEIEQAWKRMLLMPDEEAARADLQRLVHRLSGSAPAYGFETLGALARAVDERLADWQRTPAHRREPAITLASGLQAPIRDLLAAFATQAPAKAPAAADVEAAPLRVILVEDDGDQAARLAATLERHGLEIRHAADSATLWQMLVTWPCQAIVLDYWLHGETAAEIAGMLQRESSFARIARVCLTADIGLPLQQAALSAGCDAFVLKHAPVEHLVAAIRAHVASRLSA